MQQRQKSNTAHQGHHKPQPQEPPKPKAAPVPQDPNEGEGNRTAARRYDRATERYGHTGNVAKAAKAAKEALEGPERAELERAEAVGKAKASDLERESDEEGLDAEREAREAPDERGEEGRLRSN